MAKVEIYTTPICPYCARAKRLLSEKGVAFTEIDVSANPGKREFAWMTAHLSIPGFRPSPGRFTVKVGSSRP